MSSGTPRNNVRIASRISALLVGPIATVMSLLVLTVALGHCADDSWVAKVNGEVVSVREFERRIIRNRALAYNYFRQKYGAQDSADFWTTSYSGEVPVEWIRKKALDECVRIKIEQALARDKSVVGDISYTAFLDSLDRENERRRKALAAGQPIYGPQQYKEDEYFTYLFNNMLVELKRRLSQQEFHVSEETLRARYEADKDRLYARGDRVRAWVIEMPFYRRQDRPEPLTREQAKARIEEVKARLDKGELFEELATAYNEDRSLGEQTFDDTTARLDSSRRAEMRAQAMKLAEGETSDIFEELGTFYIVKGIEKESLGYQLFAKVRHNVRSRYVEERYEALIARLVTKAKVEINRSVYDSVQAR